MIVDASVLGFSEEKHQLNYKQMILLKNLFILRDLKKCTCITVYKEQMKQQDQERSKSPLKIFMFSFLAEQLN